MNILKIGDVEVESTGDMLHDIFKMQQALEDKYRPIEKKNGIPQKDSNSIDDPLSQYTIKDMAYRCITEIVEATECLKNKPWKQAHIPTDVEHLKEELADALHFFLALCLLVGMDADQLYWYYMKKNKVNGWRIKSGY